MRQQHRLRLSFFIGTIALLAVVPAAAAPTDATVAPCDKAIIGHGSADWRSGAIVAGPVGVMRPPLGRMSETKKGLVTKMPILIEGREPETVAVSVPTALRKRAFLYYGGASSFARDRGYGEVQFELCGNKPRTIWPGGIRVKGHAPIRLEVSIEGRPEPYLLRLGKPKVYEPVS